MSLSEGFHLYNDIDAFACQWLRNLIADDRLPAGVAIPGRMETLTPTNLREFHSVHFFAGIGGWPLALRMAKWPPEIPVWTGSCPCQPYSVSGKKRTVMDERDLWPKWFRLISICKPPIIFGEQVASPDGRIWLSEVRDDLEQLGYGVGAADLCAAGIGATHIRQRLFWVAHAQRERLEGFVEQWRSVCREPFEAPALSGGESLYARFWQRSDRDLIPELNGIPRPVELLRAYGNAIVPELGALFVRGFMETWV